MGKNKKQEEKNKAKQPKKELARWKNSVPRWLGGILLFAAVWSLISNLMYWLMPPVAEFISGLLTMFGLPSEFSVFNTVVLLLLANSIRHRRRLALWIVIIYFQISYFLLALFVLLVYFMGGVSYKVGSMELFLGILGVTISFTSAVILIIARGAFPNKIVSGAWWKAVSTGVAGVFVAIAVGLVGSFALHPHASSLTTRLLRVSEEALSNFKFLLPYGNAFFPNYYRNGIFVSKIITLFVLLGFLAAFLIFIRSNQKDLRISGENELKVRKLILEYGENDSLSYFSTRRDKSVIFSRNGKAAITYGLFGSTLITGGDPIGDPKAWRDVAKRFVEMARSHGWTPAVEGCSIDGLAVYKKAGMSSALYGDEAIVLVDEFDLESAGLREVAKVLRRVEREDYQVSIRQQSEIPADELKELANLVEKWRDGEERGFAMTSSRFADPTDNRMMIAVAYDKAGMTQGVLSFVPFGDKGLSLDSMRRSPDSVNGMVTLLITSMIEEARRRGIKEVSLNFAAGRQFFVNGEQVQANSIDRSLRRVFVFFSRWYQLESLYRSNEIYMPEWRPRWICFDKGAAITEVLMAIGQAEGFVPVDPLAKVKRFFRRDNMSHEDVKFWQSEKFVNQVHKDEQKIIDAKLAEENPVSTEDEKRLEKLQYLLDAGIDIHSKASNPVQLAQLIKDNQDKEEFSDQIFEITGRLFSMRGRGAMQFADVRTGDEQIQLVLKRDRVNASERLEDFNAWKNGVQVGDLINVRGGLMRTQTGALSLAVQEWDMAAKAIKSLTDSEKENLAETEKIAALKAKLYQAGYQEAKLEALIYDVTKIFQIKSPEQKLEIYSSQLYLAAKIEDTLGFSEFESQLINKDSKLDEADEKLLELLDYGLPAFVKITIDLKAESKKEAE